VPETGLSSLPGWRASVLLGSPDGFRVMRSVLLANYSFKQTPVKEEEEDSLY
jgi:hypothetical protein